MLKALRHNEVSELCNKALSIIKYEPFKRNKAALTLFWDLNARNHEVTLLKIKHVRLRDRYGVNVRVTYHEHRGCQAYLPKPIIEMLDNPKSIKFIIKDSKKIELKAGDL